MIRPPTILRTAQMYTGVSTEPTFTPYATAVHLHPHTTLCHHHHHHFFSCTTGCCCPVVLILIFPSTYTLTFLVASTTPPQSLHSSYPLFSFLNLPTTYLMPLFINP